jgi:hypothetical protein
MFVCTVYVQTSEAFEVTQQVLKFLWKNDHFFNIFSSGTNTNHSIVGKELIACTHMRAFQTFLFVKNSKTVRNVILLTMMTSLLLFIKRQDTTVCWIWKIWLHLLHFRGLSLFYCALFNSLIRLIRSFGNYFHTYIFAFIDDGRHWIKLRKHVLLQNGNREQRRHLVYRHRDL